MKSRSEHDTPHRALAREVARQRSFAGAALSLAESETIVRVVLQEIRQHLLAHGRLSLRGFGVFAVRRRRARRIRDFEGEYIEVPESATVQFRPAFEFKWRLRQHEEARR